MIKSLLDSDSDETGQSSADAASAGAIGSFLDLKMPDKPVESLDPFAITDRHPVAQPSASVLSADENTPYPSTGLGAEEPKKRREYVAPTAAETVRMSGLAWSAGIMFFGSVGLMMVFGWLVDTVLGSSPWGIVGGIVLGSVIGFVQLVRINTQLLKTTSSAPRSLLEQAAAENDKNKVSAVSESAAATEPFPEVAAALAEETDESTRTL